MRISAETRNRVPAKATGLDGIGLMIDEVATRSFAAMSVAGRQEAAWKQQVPVAVVMTGGDRAYAAAALPNGPTTGWRASSMARC